MQLKTTATVEVQSSKKWSGLKHHMQHDPNINHSNKDINQSLTKYNVHGVIARRDKILKQHYGQFIAEHDAKQKRSDRKYGSIAAYLEKQHGQPEITAVATFGSKEIIEPFNDELYQETLRSANYKGNLSRVNFDRHLRATYAEGLKKYAQGFNKRNSHITLAEYYIHVDEAGAPHLHFDGIPRGHTATGKPSERFTRALVDQYGTDDEKHAKSGKENGIKYMRKWRAQEDEALVRCMNAAFKERFNVPVKFELTRTGLALNLPMDVYKKHADEIVKLKQTKAALETENKDLQASVDRENKRSEELKQANDDLAEKLRREEIDRIRRKKEQAKERAELDKKHEDIEQQKQEQAKERAELDKKHEYIEQQKQKIVVAKRNLDAEREQNNQFYVLLGKAYSLLGKNFQYKGKNVNYEVAKGKLVPREFNKSGVPLLADLIRTSAVERLKQLQGLTLNHGIVTHHDQTPSKSLSKSRDDDFGPDL
ncbi:hypothetical protein [Limosilactobacillus fermentum]|uniref:hypothetical protein n=3 Tax=Limosilactobacillus fermentum TaxID=1613 RepID=UPI0021BF5A67|nr:hypothetical protein [Limosilactobacillus fermentum]